MSAAVLPLPADASIEHADALLRAVDDALAAAGGAPLVIDAAPLAQFDTSTIAVLLHARRAAAARGGSVALRGAPAKLHELARLYGVEPLLPPAPAGVAAAG